MKRNAHQQLQLLGLGAILVLSGSALLGFWQARQTSAEDSGHGRQVSLVGHTTEQAEHIEQALAQAGCPGWMVLASEGPTALGPEIVPVELRSPVNSIPSIRYPQPLRIATRQIGRAHV